MDDIILSTIRLANECSQAAYNEGYRVGYNEGVEAAKRLIDKHFAPHIEHAQQPVEEKKP